MTRRACRGRNVRLAGIMTLVLCAACADALAGEAPTGTGIELSGVWKLDVGA